MPSVYGDFQTPPMVCGYMVGLMPKGVRTVLEPTAGAGNIISALKHLSTAKITAPKDFFLMKKKRFDCVLMNPPFSLKYANTKNAPSGVDVSGMKVGYHILHECMKMSDNVIALMPWFTISDSDVRLRHIKSTGLRSVTLLPRKTFEYARIQTCIFEIKRGYLGSTEFKVFDLL